MNDKTYTDATYQAKQVGADGVPIYTFLFTNDRLDRQGEVVTLEGWDFTQYLTNPVVLDSHQYTSIEAIVGRCVAISRSDAGWLADIRFNDSEYGALARSLVEGGDLRAVSVGFRPLAIEYPDMASLRASRAVDDDTIKALVTVAPDPRTAVRHVRKELLEISVVPIPANADAIRVRSVDPPVTTSGTAMSVVKIEAPGWLRQNARQGLEWHAEGLSGDGVTDQTLAEARAMAGGNVSDDKAVRMGAWFARHMTDLDAPSADRGHPDYPSPGVVAHALWGGGSRTESERAASWARGQSGKGADASPPDRDIVTASTGFVRDVWPSVASAMLAVLTSTADDATRRRAYNGLERVYKVLGKEPPEFMNADTVAKLGTAERNGMFWEGEPTHAKAAGPISPETEALIRQAHELIMRVVEALDETPDTVVTDRPSTDEPVMYQTADPFRAFDPQALRAFLETRK